MHYGSRRAEVDDNLKNDLDFVVMVVDRIGIILYFFICLGKFIEDRISAEVFIVVILFRTLVVIHLISSHGNLIKRSSVASKSISALNSVERRSRNLRGIYAMTEYVQRLWSVKHLC